LMSSSWSRPHPAPTAPAGSRRSPDGRSVQPSPPAGGPPRSGRSCPRSWAPRGSSFRRRAAWGSPLPSPEAESSSLRTADSRSCTGCSSDPCRSPPASTRPRPVRPCWPSPADTPPTPPTWRSQTAFLVASACPCSSSRAAARLTERTSHDDPAPSLHPHRAKQGLHRYYRPVRRRTPRRYSAPCGFGPLGTLPVTAQGTVVSGFAFPRSVQQQQTRITSPSCRTPSGQSAGTRQTHPGPLELAPVLMPPIYITALQQRSPHRGLRTVFLIPT
jgi:hypothetical protein